MFALSSLDPNLGWLVSWLVVELRHRGVGYEVAWLKLIPKHLHSPKFTPLYPNDTNLKRIGHDRQIPDNRASARDVAARSVAKEKSMVLNVMEAVKTEWDDGQKDNGYVGLAVAHYTVNRGNKYTITDSSGDRKETHRAK